MFGCDAAKHWLARLLTPKGVVISRRMKMTQVYFHCSNRREALVDRRGAMVADLIEARDQGASVVRSLTTVRSLEDWRRWILHVNDDLGDELFVIPFAFVLGKP